MSRWEKYLPIALCLLMPGASIINNFNEMQELGWQGILTRWALFSVILWALWKLNERISRKLQGSHKWVTALGINLLIILIFVSFQLWLLPDSAARDRKFPIIFLTVRLTFVVIIFLAIIENFRVLRERARLREENLTLLSENLKAQFDQLKQQVNPHFLFNSLSTLRTMVRSQDAQAEEYVLKLANVYRQILTQRQSDTISLEEELTFLESYLYLLKLRHENALQIEQSLAPASQGFQLPGFALQLLVENALKHNIASESRPLHLRIFQPDEEHIAVSNTYQPKTVKPESFGVGLANLKERYRLLGLEDGVLVQPTETEYTVTLALLKP
ncbi:MAG: histidine kinase [Bacteroidota bacterium]